ncbi:MAG: hypothetical protein JRI67_06440 [Deltaproteobacteria bacterium]|nr:hypothetical protein [Deltaproteobacteria bacterium]MBW1938393.1 hypothetical protein [Deltaproteobacteria bacterium]MBW1965614.1 hypothetical protein [Deltaproteobacteria bacterium]MBW2079962.1 hypothetical protein [Deltaproteobacteria bacterium]
MAYKGDFSMANKDEWMIDASVASVVHHGQDLILTLKANTEYPVRPPKEPSLDELRIRNFTRNVEVGWPIFGKKFECLIGSIIYNREGLTELTEKTDFHD